MSASSGAYATLDEWIAREAIPFSLESPESLNAAVDRLVEAMGVGVELLGLGEGLHGGEEILVLRNRLFRRLVEAHGYTAIALESSYPRGRLVNDYVAGQGPSPYDEVREGGFSHGFGMLEANCDLVEWMRRYNADAGRDLPLHFYGFDSPTEMYTTAGPRQVLEYALDYLAGVDPAAGERHRDRIAPLLGEDAAWENPAAMMDPSQSVGLSPAAAALRHETEDLIEELALRRPELSVGAGAERYHEAVHHAVIARRLLTYHAAVARATDDRFVRLLAIRDAAMADNLAYAVERERGRGRVLVFAHNSHLQRGRAEWQLGENLHTWWPAGGHLAAMFGACYVVVGSGLGVSDENGIGAPEEGTLEQRLTAAPGPARLLPTGPARDLPAEELAALPVRSGSARNSSYFALTPRSLSELDWLVVLDASGYARGGPPLP